ncbi:phosphoglucan water dikinase chloroplastic-like [Trifolium pratense]|uniref:Phosphoglucan water dikinase chloroplastic-like n=1 Tax=Trifolium pratense TaxID=57577 RepID=A0A2K3NDK6_TRIPR|nr:phosphoglucan water dikinase chloroplastic-like [Trifolium pratense]
MAWRCCLAGVSKRFYADSEFPVCRKIHPCLLSFKPVFTASIPPTRIRDIAHGNDIPHDLKQVDFSCFSFSKYFFIFSMKLNYYGYPLLPLLLESGPKS